MQHLLEVGRFLREIWTERINASSNSAERLGFFWILGKLNRFLVILMRLTFWEGHTVLMGKLVLFFKENVWRSRCPVPDRWIRHSSGLRKQRQGWPGGWQERPPDGHAEQHEQSAASRAHLWWGLFVKTHKGRAASFTPKTVQEEDNWNRSKFGIV